MPQKVRRGYSRRALKLIEGVNKQWTWTTIIKPCSYHEYSIETAAGEQTNVWYE